MTVTEQPGETVPEVLAERIDLLLSGSNPSVTGAVEFEDASTTSGWPGFTSPKDGVGLVWPPATRRRSTPPFAAPGHRRPMPATSSG